MAKLSLPGLIGNNCETDNAHVIEISKSYNGSGDDAFGGADEWPTLYITVGFQTGEGQRAVRFARKLSTLIKEEFSDYQSPAS
jgi:hypothetical protein